jgi:hypothetical protein
MPRRPTAADILSSTCIISIIRLFTLRAALNTPDPTWDNVPTSYWSVAELNIGILCASLATLRPLLRRIVPGLRSHSEIAYQYKSDLKSAAEKERDESERAGGVRDIYAIPDLESPEPASSAMVVSPDLGLNVEAEKLAEKQRLGLEGHSWLSDGSVPRPGLSTQISSSQGLGPPVTAKEEPREETRRPSNDIHVTRETVVSEWRHGSEDTVVGEHK